MKKPLYKSATIAAAIVTATGAIIASAIAGLATKNCAAHDDPSRPLTLVPDLVSGTSTYPRKDDKHAAATITRGSGDYSIELDPGMFSVGIAGACWNLSRSVDVTKATRLVFWVRTELSGDFEFKAERADRQDNHQPIIRPVEAGPWSAAYVPIAALDPKVPPALGRLCVGTNTTIHPGIARIDVEKIEVQ
jgi:hypothetical protein